MQLILIRGLPGSGKSTLAKSLGFTHFEADMFFGEDYQFDAIKLKDAHAWCQQSTEEALANGQNVVVSNTFTQAWEMEPYFKMAKKWGVKPQVILCQGKFKNIHNVPENAIERMRQRFQYDV